MSTAEPKNDLQAIYEQLLAGDESARERLIVAAMPLARHVAKSKSYKQWDDTIGNAYLALVRFVNRLAPPAVRNIGQVIAAAVRNSTLDFNAEDRLLGYCARH